MGLKDRNHTPTVCNGQVSFLVDGGDIGLTHLKLSCCQGSPHFAGVVGIIIKKTEFRSKIPAFQTGVWPL